MTPQEFVVWAAGFFDGEGHIQIRQNVNGGWNLAIKVGQKSPELLLLFQIKWGGVIRVNETGKGQHAWILQKQAQMADFLTAVRPYLLGKADQADVMLQYFAIGSGRSIADTEARHDLARRVVELRNREEVS